MAFLDFIKAAPYLDPIQDQEQIKARYKYWRIRIFYSMFMGYSLFYFTRKSFTFAMPSLIADLGFQKSELGFLATVLALSYGFSKFVSGILSDRSNPRYFLPIGLILTGVCNIFFGLSSSLWMFALLWGMNGWFQGFGWPPCARLLTHWYSQNERGRWWSSFNASHNTGGGLIPLLAAVCAVYFSWRGVMIVPGILSIGVGLLLINRLRDTPQSLGLPSIEAYRNDYGGSGIAKGEKERELTTKEILFKYVLNNPAIWLLAVAYFFVYVVRLAAYDWSALYLVESKHYEQLAANACVTCFEIGGFLGNLAAGWGSDRLFKAQRVPISVIFSVGMLLAVGLFWIVPEGLIWLDYVSMFLIGFFVFGPQMIIGIACAELSHKKAAATATGFAGWVAYIGAAMAGYPLGMVIDSYGWSGYFVTVAVCCGAAIVLLLPLWNAQRDKSKIKVPNANMEPDAA